MDFTLADEQMELRDTLRRFCQQECPPQRVREWESTESFPRDVWQRLAVTGAQGLPLSGEYGGAGASVFEEALVTQELAYWANPLAVVYITTVSFGGYTLDRFGSPEQKRELIPRLAAGELIMALALTEPEGGTDILRNLNTKAHRDGNRYLISGQKIFCTSADLADLLVVVARTRSDARPRDGISIFLVDPHSPGIEIQPQEKMGNRVPHSCTVYFSEVEVPCENLLGEEDEGWSHLVHTLNNERILIAAQCVGLGRAALDYAVGYVKERHAFGRPIGQFQAVQHQLADAATKLDLAELQVQRASWLQSHERDCARDAVMAKLYASEAAYEATYSAMQVMGGHGYVADHPVERLFRDARLFTLGPISNEMCRNQVAESLGLPRSY